MEDVDIITCATDMRTRTGYLSFFHLTNMAHDIQRLQRILIRPGGWIPQPDLWVFSDKTHKVHFGPLPPQLDRIHSGVRLGQPGLSGALRQRVYEETVDSEGRKRSFGSPPASKGVFRAGMLIQPEPTTGSPSPLLMLLGKIRHVRSDHRLLTPSLCEGIFVGEITGTSLFAFEGTPSANMTSTVRAEKERCEEGFTRSLMICAACVGGGSEFIGEHRKELEAEVPTTVRDRREVFKIHADNLGVYARRLFAQNHGLFLPFSTPKPYDAIPPKDPTLLYLRLFRQDFTQEISIFSANHFMGS
jgi:hypothetical protein